MKRIFLVVAKLVGLLQLYWTFVNFMQIGFAISMIIRSEAVEVGQAIAGVIGIALYLCLSLGMSWILLARTDWLADKLNIKDDDGCIIPKGDAILRNGTILIGIYISAYAIPGLAKAIAEYATITEWRMGVRFWTQILPEAIQLLLGLYLTFKSSKVTEMITKEKSLTEQGHGA